MTIDEAANGQVVSLPSGEALEICLGEVRTQGYRWSVEDSGEPMLTLESERFYAPPHAAQGGKHVWCFRAQSPGESRIRLCYRSAWSSATPLQTFELLLSIEEERARRQA